VSRGSDPSIKCGCVPRLEDRPPPTTFHTVDVRVPSSLLSVVLFRCVIPEVVEQVNELMDESPDNTSPVPLDFDSSPVELGQLTDKQILKLYSEDVLPLSGSNHVDLLLSAYTGVDVTALHTGEAHVLFAATQTRDAARFCRLMTIWFLYMCRLGLRRYMHRTITLLHSFGVSFRRQRAKEVWIGQRNVMNEAIQCRRFLRGNELRMFSPHVCEHGEVSFPYYRQKPVFVSAAKMSHFEEFVTFVAGNPPNTYYHSDSTDDEGCACCVVIDEPRLSASSDQVHAHPSDPQDTPTEVYRQQLCDERVEEIAKITSTARGRRLYLAAQHFSDDE
jgi:hypothetical protein